MTRRAGRLSLLPRRACGDGARRGRRPAHPTRASRPPPSSTSSTAVTRAARAGARSAATTARASGPGNLYVQYWLYYADSSTCARGATCPAARAPTRTTGRATRSGSDAGRRSMPAPPRTTATTTAAAPVSWPSDAGLVSQARPGSAVDRPALRLRRQPRRPRLRAAPHGAASGRANRDPRRRRSHRRGAPAPLGARGRDQPDGAAAVDPLDPRLRSRPDPIESLGPEARTHAVRDRPAVEKARLFRSGGPGNLMLGPAYRGGIRRAPSSLIVSPFSIGFSTMWRARAANSSGWPSRLGKGIWAPSSSRASSGQRGQQRGVEGPGGDRHHPDPAARQIAGGRQREADDAALRRRVGDLADLAVEGGDRGGVDADAALAPVVGLVVDHRGGGEPQDVEGADQVHLDHVVEDLQVVRPLLAAPSAGPSRSPRSRPRSAARLPRRRPPRPPPGPGPPPSRSPRRSWPARRARRRAPRPSRG